SMGDRPHRLARLLKVPPSLEVVTREQLEALAALLPEPPQAVPRSRHDSHVAFDLAQWIAEHGLTVASCGPWGNGGMRWILNPCPWNSDHANRAAFIVQLPSGAIAAGCHHNGCAGNDWHALRDLYEPGWREVRHPSPQLHGSGQAREDAYVRQNGQADTNSIRSSYSLNSFSSLPPWPQMAPEAFYGVAGPH